MLLKICIYFGDGRKCCVDTLPHNPDFLMNPNKKPFENIKEIGENTGNQHFLLFIRPSKTGRIMGSPVVSGQAASPFFVWSISPRLC